MRFLFGILALTFLTTPTRATVFQVNLNDLAITDAYTCPGYCGGGPIYQKLSALPGDVFDFGSVEFHSFADTHTYEMIYRGNQNGILNVNLGQAVVSFDEPLGYGYTMLHGYPGLTQVFNPSYLPITHVEQLLFVIPDGKFSIQIGFTLNGVLAPPVATIPELSTWAMLLIGFGGLGLAACRRRNSVAALGLTSSRALSSG